MVVRRYFSVEKKTESGLVFSSPAVQAATLILIGHIKAIIIFFILNG